MDMAEWYFEAIIKCKNNNNNNKKTEITHNYSLLNIVIGYFSVNT